MLALPILLVGAMFCNATASGKKENRILTDAVILYVGITYLPGKSPCKYCRRR